MVRIVKNTSYQTEGLMKLFLPSILLLSTIIAPNVYAQNAKLIPANKLYGFYDKFLELPPQKRDHIKIQYGLVIKEGKLEGLNLVYKGQKTKIEYDRNGKILTYPSYDALKNGQVEIIGVKKGGFSIDAIPLIPVSNRISVAIISDAISDFHSSLSVAGPLAIMVPKLNSIKFVGVNAAFAVFSDGRKMPITENDKGVIFNPNLAKYKGAVNVELAQTPTNIEYAK